MLRWRIKESDGGIEKRGVFLTILRFPGTVYHISISQFPLWPAAFHVEGRPAAEGRPQSLALPSDLRIVDASIVQRFREFP